MKPFFACLILVVLAVNGVHALPSETLRVADQESKLLVQCGMRLFDPTRPLTSGAIQETSNQETSEKVSAPAESPQVDARDAPIPEPSSLPLLGCGLFIEGLLGLRRRAPRRR